MYVPKPREIDRRLIVQIFDAFSLAKPFEYQVEITFEETLQTISSLAKSKTKTSNKESRIVRLYEGFDETYDFDVDMYVHGNGRSRNTANATGVLFVDEAIKKTIVRGKVRLRIFFLVFPIALILTPCLILDASFRLKSFLLFSPFLCLIVYWLYKTGIAERNKLYNLMHDTFSAK